MRNTRQQVREESGRTDWTGLEHKFPYERVGTTFVEVALDEVGLDDQVRSTVCHLRGKLSLLDSDHPAVGTFTTVSEPEILFPFDFR